MRDPRSVHCIKGTITPGFNCPNMTLPIGEEFEVIKFTVKVDGQEGVSTVPVKDNDNIYMSIPEGTKYTTSIHFKVFKPIKNFKYIQIGKKAGITVKKTEKYLGDSFEPQDEDYVIEFPEDETPAGFFFRGKVAMNSTYYLGDKDVLSVDWTVDITKKP